MAITILNVAAGQLAAVSTPPAAMYAGSTVKATIVKGIIMTNRGTGTESINVYLKRGATGPLSASSPLYLLSPKALQLPPGGQAIIDTEFTLGTGVNAGATYADQILGSTTTASMVDFVINGMQRDL